MKTLQQHRARPQRWLATLTIALLALGAPLATAAPAFASEAPPVIEQTPLEQEPAEQEPAEQAAPEQEPAAPEADQAADVADAPAPVAAARAEAPAPQAAFADAAAPTVTLSQAPHDGGAVVVRGTGFAASAPGVYLGVGTAGAASFYGASLVASETIWISIDNTAGSSDAGKTAPMNADGSFEVTVTVPATSDAVQSYAVYTSKAHGQGFSDKSQNTATTVAFAPKPLPAPTVTVSKTQGLNAAGETVTVTGSGFLPTPETTGTRPPLAGKFTGAYVVFGRFADVWAPSANAPTAARAGSGDVKWAVHAEDMATIGGDRAGAIEVKPDGTFTATLKVTEEFAKNPGSGNYGIYTYGGGGAKYAPFETFTPITFAPTVVAPTVMVSKTEGLNAAGETVTVTGSGFLPTPETTGTRPPLAGKFTGAYVVFGRFADVWAPSANAPTAARAGSGDVKWAVHAEDMATIGGDRAGAIEVKPDGTFTATLKVTEEFAKNPGSGNYGIYTYGGGGAKYAPFETFTPISFAAVVPPVVVPPVVTPPVVTPPAVQSGSLSWGVSSAFRNYITTIAQGSFAVGNGATSSGGAFHFGQSGGSFNQATGTGAADYTGSVRFTGHAGVLDLTFSNPTIRVGNERSATLELSVNGSRVDFASVNLAAASRTNVNGATVFSGAPVTLSAAGSRAFEGFYGAGTSLDSLTVTIGSAGAAPSGSTGTIATASVRTPAQGAVPATPPATEGITLTPAVLGSIVAGGQISFEADGFQPNETGIRVVIYSTPTVLAENLTADANGVVRWSGTLPATLTGEHTLTVQGSISKGVVITIPERAAAGSCLVEGATLDWGFKQSFLAYISSGIANGGWELSGGTTEIDGLFHWADGTGSIDTKTGSGLVSFAGGIRFTGHDGALDTTIANPRIELVSETEGYLVVDVTGTTQQGEPIDGKGLRFGQLTLGADSLVATDAGITGAAIEAVLTDAGAAAFGTYPAGDALDPISFTLPTPADCGVVAGEAVSAEAGPSDKEVTAISAETAEQGVSWVVWVLAAALAAALAVIIVLLAKRRRVGADTSAE